ncbi:MAG: hydroxymethylglutaryl-CoA lyase [Sporomusaceae bacterium]|nr:hydroxymethylglutaryl-CoA lyase [Sporomusaceae bacterium]
MLEATADAIWPERVLVCEVGPRDGLQNEKTLLSLEQKVELIERSVEAGAKVVEIGSFVHPQAVPAMADTEAVAKRLKAVDGVEYRALVLNLRGMERAEAAGLKKVKLTASASRTHSLANANKTPEEVVRSFSACADYAAKHGMALSGAIPTAFGCSFEGRVPLTQVLSVVDCFYEIGVRELSLSDTTGMANPCQVLEYSRKVKAMYPDVDWVLHFHNTRGMGLANVTAGLLAGIERYDASFAGLGGCPFVPDATGNIATEDLLHMLQEMGIETGFDLDKMLAVARAARTMVGHETASFILKAGKNSDLVQCKQTERRSP